MRRIGGETLLVFAMAVILVYLVLAAQYESWLTPAAVILVVPLGVLGAVVAVSIRGLDNNVYTQIGIVLIIALASKNAILIVEFANAQQLAGHSKLEAVKSGALTRLRPILMTTIATVVGHFPLTLVTGAGAVARNSIGIVLVGGMTIGTLFTLFVVPSVYVLLAKDHQAHKAKESASDASAHAEPQLLPSPAE